MAGEGSEVVLSLGSEPAGYPGGRHWRLPMPATLRAKGIWAFVALVLYLAAIGLLASRERTRLLISVVDLEAIHAVEEKLAKVNTSVAHAVLKSQEAYYSPDARISHESIVLDIEAIQAGLEELRTHEPKFANNIARLERDLASMRASPARAGLIDLRLSLFDLVEHLDLFTRQVRAKKDALSERYRLAYDAITLITLIGGVVGFMVFGGIVMLFFTHLAWDIKKLETRALEIVTGYRGAPLAVARHDEIGSLMHSVNRMQFALRAHENQIEMSRQQRFHQDKMAAIGSLASGIAHEINNPIAAIHGVAQHMCDVKGRRCAGVDGADCEPQLILDHARRISMITRQMSQLSRPNSSEAALVDVNGLVRSTCGFVRYDKRFRSVRLDLELDDQLPAVCCVADHVTQVLMNLLLNAADATEGIPYRRPAVTVRTSARDAAVRLSVIDNGTGMAPDVLARAFDESYTTKPVGKGTGLGLFICKSLIEQAGGCIDIESTPGEGTTVVVELPLQAGEA